jgi:hypothetical protein
VRPQQGAQVVSSFVVRIGLPMDSNQPLNVKLWGWPEYLAMFGLGVVAARRGWLRPVPGAISRRCGIATLAATLVIVIAAVTTDLRGLDQDAYFGGWGLLALVWAMGEGTLVVSGPIWVLASVQRHLNGSGPLRRAMARSSYLAFMPVSARGARAGAASGPSGHIGVRRRDAGHRRSFALAWPLVTDPPSPDL